MRGKVAVVIERDDCGYFAWCPSLRGCHSQGHTAEAALANVREAIQLYLETMEVDERTAALSREILTTAVDVRV